MRESIKSIAVKFQSNSSQILPYTNIPERDRTYTQSKHSNLWKKNTIINEMIRQNDRTIYENDRSGFWNDSSAEPRKRTTQKNHVKEPHLESVNYNRDGPDKYSAEFTILQSSPTTVSWQIPALTNIPERVRTTCERPNGTI
jgi:hypothetical protein